MYRCLMDLFKRLMPTTRLQIKLANKHLFNNNQSPTPKLVQLLLAISLNNPNPRQRVPKKDSYNYQTVLFTLYPRAWTPMTAASSLSKWPMAQLHKFPLIKKDLTAQINLSMNLRLKMKLQTCKNLQLKLYPNLLPIPTDYLRNTEHNLSTRALIPISLRATFNYPMALCNPLIPTMKTKCNNSTPKWIQQLMPKLNPILINLYSIVTNLKQNKNTMHKIYLLNNSPLLPKS